ncbi:MAG: DMT family transporter [Vicinamibacteria bacterium]|nr:DMT family transporter [Vicinamibacteria bacterium]
MAARAYTALLLACALWAVSFVATKKALELTPPLAVVALRLALSAACFLIWLAIRRRRLPLVALLDWRGRLVLLSLCGGSLHYGLQTIGLQYTSASNGSLYAVTAPVTIAVLGVIFLGERPTFGKTAGIAVALAGVLTVMGLDELGSVDLGGRVFGDLLVLASIVFWGVFTVLGKTATDRFGAPIMTATVTVLASLTMLPVGLWEIETRGLSLRTISAEAWAAIAFLGVGCSFLATLLYFVALEMSESQKVGVFLYTIPPMTAVVAKLALDETLGLRFFVGSAMVIGGVIITERSR